MIENKQYEILHETKEHSSTFFPYNTYLCTLPLDFTRVSPHWHDDMELIVIKSGKGIVNVDMESFRVKEGEVIVVRPGQIHSIYQDGNYEMEYENIIFNTKLLYTESSDLYTVEFFENYLNLEYKMPVHINEFMKNKKALSNCIACIDGYCSSTPENYQIIIKSYLYQFFFIFAQNQDKLVVSESNKSLRKMKQSIRYVELHYMEDISIDLVAKEVGFSSSHFMKIFKQNMHTTFTNYLNDYRLVKSCELLTSTDYSVVEVMERVGFNNLSYFNRLFKEYFNMTPREYRKGQKNSNAELFV